jgi:hypothetical protein
MNINFNVHGDAYEVPFVFYDIENKSLTSSFEPSTAKYIQKGFWVKPDTAGTLKVITLKQYRENEDSISGLSYVDVYVNQYEWLLTPVVAVNSASDASNINVGLY